MVSSKLRSGINILPYIFKAASELSGSWLLFNAAKLNVTPGMRCDAKAKPKFIRFSNDPVFIQYWPLSGKPVGAW